MSNHEGYFKHHATAIEEFRRRQQSGLESGPRREELTRVYEREVANHMRGEGSDSRFPRTFEEFARGEQYRDDYSQWTRNEQQWLVTVEKRVLDYEGAIQEYTLKGSKALELQTPMAIRTAMEKQDFARTRQLEKYTFLDHPKLPLSDPRNQSEMRAVQEYNFLTESCAKEVARRQSELPAVLADTLSLVRRELSNPDAVIEAKNIQDPSERQRYMEALRQFNEEARKAGELLTEWTNLLDRADVDPSDMLGVLARRGTLENLYKLAIDLWPGLVHDKAPNTAYRLPALTAMIGRQLGEQLYARARPRTYERAMMRLAEVPIRRGAHLLDISSYGTDRHGFEIEIDKWFHGIKGLSSKGKQQLAQLAKQVRNHEFNDAFYAAREALQTKEPGPVTGVNPRAYDVVATLATRARELRALVEKGIADTDSHVGALESFSEVLDTAIISIKDRLQVRAGESLPAKAPDDQTGVR